MKTPRNALQVLINNSTIVLFVVVFVVFGLSSPLFFQPDSIINNVIKASAYTGIIAIGITFVLLTGGIDLSLGSNMYLSSVIAGLLMRNQKLEVLPALIVAMLVGMVYGYLNAVCIVRLKIVPFMATLATLVIGRGLGTALTESKQIDFPVAMTQFGQTPVLGLPMPVIVFLLVALVAYIMLTQMPIGRQIYAVGNDPEAAKKAGINTDRVMTFVYVVSGFCAGIAGFILISQIGRLDRSFAEGREFDAIAASVLGGTSLFGGVGTIPGAVIGTLLTQMVNAGMIFNNINLYIQPMVRSAIIFIAVFFDSLRSTNLERLKRRFIRPIDAEKQKP